MKSICLIFVFLLSIPCVSADSCYETYRNKGIKEYNAGHYRKAKELFTTTNLSCDDVPKNNDLQTWIKKCDDRINEAKEERQRRQEEQIPNTTLDATKKSLLFGSSGGSESLMVITNFHTWRVKSSPDWCTMSKDGNNLFISCEENPHTEERSGGVDVIAGDMQLRINISQRAAVVILTPVAPIPVVLTTLSVSKQDISFSSSGSSQNIEVTTNFATWDVNSLPDWCNSKKSGNILILTCHANTGEERFAWFVITADNRQVVLSVSQAKCSNALTQGKWRLMIDKVMNAGISKTYQGGDKYKGQLLNNQREGSGLTLIQSTGNISIGNCSSGKMSGLGMYMIPDGYSIGYCENGQYYVGEWGNDRRTGQGACYDEYGNLIYYGKFMNNAPTESYPSEGDYSEWKFECQEFSNGDKYVGETKKGKKDGQGIHLFSNGDMWYGSWKGDTRSGKGILIKYDGSIE
jgi:hypothetical protein